MGSAVMRQPIVSGAGILFAASMRSKLQVSPGFMAAIGSWGVVPPARVRMVARSLVFLEGALAGMAFAALSVPALWAVTVAASAGGCLVCSPWGSWRLRRSRVLRDVVASGQVAGWESDRWCGRAHLLRSLLPFSCSVDGCPDRSRGAFVVRPNSAGITSFRVRRPIRTGGRRARRGVPGPASVLTPSPPRAKIRLCLLVPKPTPWARSRST